MGEIDIKYWIRLLVKKMEYFNVYGMSAPRWDSYFKFSIVNIVFNLVQNACDCQPLSPLYNSIVYDGDPRSAVRGASLHKYVYKYIASNR